MAEHDPTGLPQEGGTNAAPFDQFLHAIEQIAVALSQQNAQIYQDFQSQLNTYQQQLQASLTAAAVPREYRLEGISMPTFSGKPSESVDEFIFRAKLFFEGKNIDYAAAANQQRVLAMLAANLRDGAASWYHAQVVIDHVRFVDIDELEEALRSEFVPPDQQFRLRSELKTCRQKGSVDEYVREFRRLMAHVRDMSALDQVDRFCDGLKPETRKEVMYLRCGSLAEAISAAQAFERTHFRSGPDRSRVPESRPRPSRSAFSGPTPMDISAVDTRSIDKEQCRSRNLCFYCKSTGHRIAQCPRRRQREQQGNENARRM